MARKDDSQKRSPAAPKRALEACLEEALRTRFDHEVDFPTEHVSRTIEALLRRCKVLDALEPLGAGQVRLVSERRLFVLLLDQRENDLWWCAPIHHFAPLRGPGDVEIAPGCYVETYLGLAVPAAKLRSPGMRVAVIAQKKLDEIRQQAAANINLDFKNLKGALAIFRASEAQYVMSCDLVRLMELGQSAMQEVSRPNP